MAAFAQADGEAIVLSRAQVVLVAQYALPLCLVGDAEAGAQRVAGDRLPGAPRPRFPSAMRPSTPQHNALRRYKVTHHGTEKNAPLAR